jgi:excisionase family DNA binding protein
MSTNDLLSTSQAAAELGLSERWVRRLVELGRLPAQTEGPRRSIRIRRSDLERARSRRWAGVERTPAPSNRLVEPTWDGVLDEIDRWLVMPLRPYGLADARDALRLRMSRRERLSFAHAIVTVARGVSAADGNLTLRLRSAISEALSEQLVTPGPAGDLIRRREVRRAGTIAGIAAYLAHVCETA